MDSERIQEMDVGGVWSRDFRSGPGWVPSPDIISHATAGDLIWAAETFGRALQGASCAKLGVGAGARK